MRFLIMEITSHILIQEWHNYTNYLIVDAEFRGSISLLIYKDPQKYDVEALICDLWVDKDHRRLGIAKHLISKAEAIVKEKGYKYISLWWDSRDTSKDIYEWYMSRGYDSKIIIPPTYRFYRFDYQKELLVKKL